MSDLVLAERPAAQDPAGLLVLHHGRGSDEQDLLGLADALDPERRLHVVSPRAPLTLPGWGGYHWYVVPQVGRPDPATWRASVAALAGLHDELWQRTGLGPERTVLGGFSMGSVMSHSLALSAERPAPAGVLGLSGFVPEVEGWTATVPPGLRALVAHGRQDPVIGVELGRRAAAVYRDGGAELRYEEGDFAHHVDPRQLPAMVEFLRTAIP